jgi:hypothetical protein
MFFQAAKELSSVEGTPPNASRNWAGLLMFGSSL